MNTEIKEIVLKLIEKTKKNQVNWRLASDIIDDNSNDWDYAVSTSSSTINIFRVYDDERNLNGIRLNILNSRGILIYGEVFIPIDQEYDELNELLELARIKVLGIDETLKKLREELNGDSVLGADYMPF